MRRNRLLILILFLSISTLQAYNVLTDIYYEEQPGFAEIMLKFRDQVEIYRNYMKKKNIVLFFPYMDYFKDVRKIDVNKDNVKYIEIKPGKNHTLKVLISEEKRSEYKLEIVGNVVTIRVFPPKLAGAKPESLPALPKIQPSTVKQILNLKTLHYNTYGKKDIFKSLINQKSDSLLLDPLSAKLVGVIIRGKNKLGIFRDNSNKTFILKEGARVKNGKLWKLLENQAIFLVGLRGYARTIRIKLKNPMEAIK